MMTGRQAMGGGLEGTVDNSRKKRSPLVEDLAVSEQEQGGDTPDAQPGRSLGILIHVQLCDLDGPGEFRRQLISGSSLGCFHFLRSSPG